MQVKPNANQGFNRRSRRPRCFVVNKQGESLNVVRHKPFVQGLLA